MFRQRLRRSRVTSSQPTFTTTRKIVTRIFGPGTEPSTGSRRWSCWPMRPTSHRCCWKLKKTKRSIRWKRWERSSGIWYPLKTVCRRVHRNSRAEFIHRRFSARIMQIWHGCGRLNSGMNPVTTIAEIGKHEGQAVTVRGWLYNLRESGKLLFPIFRDGSGTIQGVVTKNAVPAEVFDAIKGLTQESSVIVEGKVRADKRAPGGYELDVSGVQVLQRVSENDPFPISLKEHGVDFLMDHRHLWVRTPRQAAILRVRAEIIKAARDFFDDRGFTLTDPPILTPAACEGTSTLFPVDYFEEQAYLTQSGQLYIEATAMALAKFYSFSPTFLAEKSKTRRHLTAFWMVEPEIAYAELDYLMELAEGLLTFLVKRCLDQRRPDLATIARDLAKLEKIHPPFPPATSHHAVGTSQQRHTH